MCDSLGSPIATPHTFAHQAKCKQSGFKETDRSHLGHHRLTDLPDDEQLPTHHPSPTAVVHLHGDDVIRLRDSKHREHLL